MAEATHPGAPLLRLFLCGGLCFAEGFAESFAESFRRVHEHTSVSVQSCELEHFSALHTSQTSGSSSKSKARCIPVPFLVCPRRGCGFVLMTMWSKLRYRTVKYKKVTVF